MTDYIAQVKAFVLDEFLPDDAGNQIDDDDDLLAGGVIDSLGVLKVLAWIEDEFHVPVDDLDFALENFRTVSAIASFVAATQSVSDVSRS